MVRDNQSSKKQSSSKQRGGCFGFFRLNDGLSGNLTCNLKESLVNYSLVKYQKRQ